MFWNFVQLWIILFFFLPLLCHLWVIRLSLFLSSSFGPVITWWIFFHRLGRVYEFRELLALLGLGRIQVIKSLRHQHVLPLMIVFFLYLCVEGFHQNIFGCIISIDYEQDWAEAISLGCSYTAGERFRSVAPFTLVFTTVICDSVLFGVHHCNL